MMNVLVLSHTSVLASYRRKWEILSSFPNVQLTLVIPDAWPEASLAAVRWDGRQPRSYRILCVPVWFRGRKGHITRYCFPRTPWILLRMRPDLIHVDNEPFSLSAFLATLLGRCLGSRIVFTTFENVFRTYRAPLPLFLWTVLRLAHGAQAANQEAATLLHRRNFRGVVVDSPEERVADGRAIWSTGRVSVGGRSAEQTPGRPRLRMPAGTGLTPRVLNRRLHLGNLPL